MRNFCDKREQLSLLELPSKAKILSEAKKRHAVSYDQKGQNSRKAKRLEYLKRLA